LLAAAHAFIQESQQRADSFVALGLPATFVTDLSALVARYEQTIRGRRDGKSRRDGAQAGIRTAVAKGMDAVRTLDVIVGNTLKHDPVLRAVWKSDRRVNPTRKAVVAAVKEAPVLAPPTAVPGPVAVPTPLPTPAESATTGEAVISTAVIDALRRAS
jgi:hypothetical protein